MRVEDRWERSVVRGGILLRRPKPRPSKVDENERWDGCMAMPQDEEEELSGGHG